MWKVHTSVRREVLDGVVHEFAVAIPIQVLFDDFAGPLNGEVGHLVAELLQRGLFLALDFGLGLLLHLLNVPLRLGLFLLAQLLGRLASLAENFLRLLFGLAPILFVLFLDSFRLGERLFSPRDGAFDLFLPILEGICHRLPAKPVEHSQKEEEREGLPDDEPEGGRNEALGKQSNHG